MVSFYHKSPDVLLGRLGLTVAYGSFAWPCMAGFRRIWLSKSFNNLGLWELLTVTPHCLVFMSASKSVSKRHLMSTTGCTALQPNMHTASTIPPRRRSPVQRKGRYPREYSALDKNQEPDFQYENAYLVLSSSTLHATLCCMRAPSNGLVQLSLNEDI